MAEKVIKTIIQFKRGTEAELNQVAETLILRPGEPCVTLDGEHKGQLKIGDGTSTWGQLPYLGGEVSLNATDGKSITVSQEGVLSIFGFGTATTGQQPRVGESGSLEWFTPSVTDAELKAIDTAINGDGTPENPGLISKVNSLEDNLADNYDTSTEVDEKIAGGTGLLTVGPDTDGAVENINAAINSTSNGFAKMFKTDYNGAYQMQTVFSVMLDPTRMFSLCFLKQAICLGFKHRLMVLGIL